MKTFVETMAIKMIELTNIPNFQFNSSFDSPCKNEHLKNNIRCPMAYSSLAFRQGLNRRMAKNDWSNNFIKSKHQLYNLNYLDIRPRAKRIFMNSKNQIQCFFQQGDSSRHT